MNIFFKTITQTKLIVLTVIFIAIFDNYAFFKNVLEVYPLEFANIGFIISLAAFLIAFNVLLFTLLSSKYTTKPILITLLLISSLTSYFMNSYQVVIDVDMIRNAMQTNIDESLDLFTLKQLSYLLFFGLLPSYFIYTVKIEDRGLKRELLSKLKYIAVALIIITISLGVFSKQYTSFFREHKPLRYSINPTYWIYSIGSYVKKTYFSVPKTLKTIGNDAKVIEEKEQKKELIILVVGEAARADHFSLNGYQKKTNPLLEQEDIVNFSNMYSCGTSTAYSVPCMFSMFDREHYSYSKGITTQNILDVLKHTGFVNILWRDNNSDSKGVANRVEYQDFKKRENNPVCDVECRDEGMLSGLDQYIQKHKGEDILIVLHQMGNHGPAYYKRYPKSFEKFIPACQSTQLEDCTEQEIQNAYDNALLYTDYFLSKTINFLKQYENTHATAMIYMSDHGESLGENNIYLHGLPYFMAPDGQKHIGALMWFGNEMKDEIDIEKVKQKSNKRYSHDNLFHTLLGLFEIQTKLYDQNEDIIYGN